VEEDEPVDELADPDVSLESELEFDPVSEFDTDDVVSDEFELVSQ